ncbi:MAG: glycoprotein [Ixodes ricinus bunyavirus-like virus 1]|nr:MAG: glycoprotein [Ixodes ricinus bunyavirus-like virus 1]
MNKVAIALCLLVAFCVNHVLRQTPPGQEVVGREGFVWGCDENHCGMQCNHFDGVKMFWPTRAIGIDEAIDAMLKICHSLDKVATDDETTLSLPKRKFCTITISPGLSGKHQGALFKVRQVKNDLPLPIAKPDLAFPQNWCKDLGQTPTQIAEGVWDEEQCQTISNSTVCPVHMKSMRYVVDFIAGYIVKQPVLTEPEKTALMRVIKTKGHGRAPTPSNQRYMSSSVYKSLENFWKDFTEMYPSMSLHKFIDANADKTADYEESVEAPVEPLKEVVFLSPREEPDQRSGPKHHPLPEDLKRTNKLGHEDIGKAYLDLKRHTRVDGKKWTESKLQYGYVVFHNEECHIADRKEVEEEGKEDRVVYAAMATCAKNEDKGRCKCLGTNVPLYQEGSNDVCLMKSGVKIEEVSKSYHSMLDMCMIYCTVTTGAIEEKLRPIYRTVLYRTPFQGIGGKHTSGLEDELNHQAEQSPNKNLFYECWPESYASYMHDSEKKVLRRAFQDTNSWCKEGDDTGARDTVNIPSTCLDKDATRFSRKHLKALDERTTTWSICTKRINLCYSPVCTIQVRATSLRAEVTMKSTYAKYIIRDGKGSEHTGYFEGEKVVEIEFEEPGQRTLHGICNKSPVERKVILSTKEYCNERYPGPSGVPMNIYCKRPLLVKVTFSIFFISLIMHMGKKYWGSVVGVLGTLVTVWIVWPLLWWRTCPNCCCFMIRKSSHECLNFRCKRCYSIYSTRKKNDGDPISIPKERQVHDKYCENSKSSDSDFVLATSFCFEMISKLTECLCKVVPTLGGLTTLIILMSLVWSGADAQGQQEMHERVMSGALSDMSDYIERVEAAGFHPYNARFTPGLREKLQSIKQEKDCATKVCTVVMTVSADLEVTKGREFGFRVYPKEDVKDSNLTFMDVNVKFLEPIRECTYTHVYYTGPVNQKSESGDTCTEGCGPCFNYLRSRQTIKDLKEIAPVEHRHENSASWACNGAGCAAINNGCTCGLCWCELQSKEYSVRELVNEKAFVTLCLQFGSEGFCKKISREERNKEVTVVKGGELKQKCPQRIACKEHTGECFEGDISGLADFGDKFGSVKLVGNRTLFKSDIRTQEQCLFAKHRWFEYTQCCKDTFALCQMLKHVPFQIPAKKDYQKLTLPIESSGTWSIELRLPPYRYTRESDTLKLTALHIDSCKGCYDCEEGGSCLLHYTSDFTATPEFDCKGAQTDQSHISINRGTGQVPFNIFASKREGTINCTIGKFTAIGKFMMIDPPKYPHGDGVIKMDNKRVINNDCGHIFCNWNPFDFSFKTIKGYLSMAFLAILIVVAIVIIYYSGIGIVKSLKTVLSEKTKNRHRKVY